VVGFVGARPQRIDVTGLCSDPSTEVVDLLLLLLVLDRSPIGVHDSNYFRDRRLKSSRKPILFSSSSRSPATGWT